MLRKLTLPLMLLSVLTFSSCGDLIDDLTTVYYMNLTIDGAVIETGENVNGSGAGAITLSDTLTGDSCDVTYAATFSRIEGLQVFQVRFEGYYDGLCVTDVIGFHDRFTSGRYPFADSTSQGVNIYWRDANGVIWESKNGDQAGSIFDVDRVEEEDDDANTTHRKEMEGTFNCKLYDPNGNVATVTNGEFQLFIESLN